MDYEKKYKEALSRVKSIMAGKYETTFIYSPTLFEEIFPELKEKDSERIKKNCIHFLELQKQHHAATFEIEECIAWLEKQGMQNLNNKTAIESWKDMRLEVYQQASGNRHEPNYSDDSTKMFSLNDIDEIFEKIDEKQGNVTKLSEEEQNQFAKGVLTRCAMSFIDYLDAHKCEGKMCVSNGECEDIENAFHNSIWDKLIRYYCKYIYNTEKQGEHKPTAKFHEGQWVVYEGDGEKVTLQIARIVAETYEFTDESTVNVADEDTLHPWTIADARDGDVLTDNGSPFVFKCTKPSDIKTEIKNPLTVLGYCGIGGAGFTKSGGWGDTANCIYYPATKEQRDRLMKAMADAGYEFNFDKKELKKVEQKPAEDIDAEKVSEEYRNYRMSCGITDPVMLDEIESAYYEGAIRKSPQVGMKRMRRNSTS